MKTLLATVISLTFCFCASGIKAQTRPPNIIFILGDDIGYKVPTVNGGRSFSTPNLDTMAKQGMNLKQCHASPLCSPSRFMLMTGKYNFRNYTVWGIMDTSQRTIANMLQDAGYKTACFGKWQFGGGDFSIHKLGFDDYCVWNPLVSESSSRYKSPLLYTNGAYVPDALTLNKYAEDIFTDSVINFIDNNKTAPFFIYYPMVLAHKPFQPTPDDAAFVNWDINADDTSYFPSMVKYMDKKIGEIINKVKEAGLEDNTIIIYTGDNGTAPLIEQITDIDSLPVKGGKSATTEAGTHVPLFIDWPGTISPGSVNNDLIGFTDFLPALADLANIPVPDYGALDGVSFTPALKGNAGIPRTSLFYGYDPHPGYDYDTLNVWAQTLQYKLYDTAVKKNNHLFYNIVNDPDEKHPIANNLLTPEEVIIKQQLQNLINSYIAQGLPVLDTIKISLITDSSARIKNSIKTNFGTPITASGVVWGTGHNPVLSDSFYTDENIDHGIFYSDIKRLNPGTTYYVRTYATNTASTIYSKEKAFITVSGAPVATAATGINNTGFVANWNNVDTVANYKLDVSTLPLFSYTKPDSSAQRFDSGIAANNGWVFSASGLAIDSVSFGKASPAIRFNSTNSRVTTKTYPKPVTRLGFWLRGTKNNPGTLLLEGSDGFNWKTIDNITNITTTAVTKIYDSASFPAWANNFTRFRFTYTRLAGSTLFDDVVANYTSVVGSFVNGYNNLTVTQNSKLVTGLKRNTQYYYQVRRQDIYGLTSNSNTVSVITSNMHLDTPVCTSATQINKSSFIAHWNNVNNADKYKIDVSTFPTFLATTPVPVNEGFNNGLTPPAGWIFSSGLNFDAAHFGALSPSIRFNASGQYITTATYPTPATWLSFWLQGIDTSHNITMLGTMLVEGFNGAAWQTIDNITLTNTAKTIKTYNAASSPALGNNFIQFRFTFTRLSGKIDFDDFAVNYTLSTPSFVGNYKNLTVVPDSLQVTGLTNNTDYYYRVRATSVALSDTSANSNTIKVTSCSKPVVSGITITNVGCHGDSSGAIHLNVTGTSLAYAWTGPNSFTSTNPDINKLAAGKYKVAITSNGACEKDTNATVSEPSAIVITTQIPPIGCAGGTTVITVNASGGKGGYRYSLSNGITTMGPQSDNHFTVGAGNYTIIVTDTNHCSLTTAPISITAPVALNATATAPLVSCAGGTTVITVNASGGTGNYQYSLSDGITTTGPQSDSHFTVGTGSYTINIADSNHCAFTTAPISITDPVALSATATAPLVSCAGGTTVITVNASGGTGNYQYSLSDGITTTDPQSDSHFTVGAGSYTINIADSNHCSFTTAPISITDPVALSATATAPLINCAGGTTVITVNASGGTGNYQYSLSDGIITTGPQSDNHFTVGAGNYTIFVEDGNHCSYTTTTISVVDPPIITATTDVPLISCAGGTTVITVNASGGTGNYQYSLSDGISTTGPQSDNHFTVGAGNYTIFIEDGNHCSYATTTISVVEPPIITATTDVPLISCTGGTTVITVNASGGTGNYQYSLSDGISTTGPQSDNHFTVGAGSYTIFVEDGNHCSYTTTTISVVDPATITATADVPLISCAGGTTVITVNASGGTGNYQYSLSDGITTTELQSDNHFTVGAGNYTIFVEDGNHCSFNTEIDVEDGIGDSCNNAFALIQKNNAGKGLSFLVNVFPNPSPGGFNLVIKSAGIKEIKIIVTDLYGNKVYESSGINGGKYNFGNGFTAGIYFLQVIQGENRKTIRLIKSN